MLNAPATATTGNGVNSDNESKRQRSIYTAFEKAKATHLSRQLRLRLQYAKLKVEHGWIKQNLNEVENLYFRHSRKSRPESEPDESLERGELRPLASVSRVDNNIPSPPINSPMDEGVLGEEPVRPPSNDRPLNHQPSSLSIPAEEATSTTLNSAGSIFHRQPTTNPAPQPSFSLTPHSPAPQNLSRQPTLSSLDGSTGRSLGNSSGSTLTYDSFWSSHSSSLTYRSRLSESSFASFKQPFTTPFTHAQKLNPIIPTLSFPSSPPSSNSLHTAMGSFHHADLALAGQENGSFLPPQP
ncbi:hypothetical protein BDM02DRAFT_3273107 [Thelephora ganbajun]|uniref:Uncharacterized protein n=1 Tax=Thelephora ganbajun TaxID=370292 RepID=A0ACB6Z0Q1_THEGA|nr:hypothetical protein BDM02DRAFT_3273107 [Thelephora ganbajun]